jgi:uncharacterized protein
MMWDVWFWGGLLRFIQAAVHAGPTILTGLLVAATFHRLVGQENTRRTFGDGTWHSMPQAWVIGMLLPVCSMGVLPIVRELKRSGVTGGAILAFALSAPLFNPLSLMFGLTLSHPRAIFAFALGSLVVVTLVGLLFDWWFRVSAVSETPPRPVAWGLRRLLAILVSAAREATGASLLYILAGLTGVAILAMLLPLGSLQHSVQHDNPWAPLIMLGVSIPAFAPPMTVMGQLGSMFQHGNSVGAAFVLLTLGAGLHLGTILWIGRHYGVRRSLLWGTLLLATILGIAYGLERPLYPRDVDPADHTHAFDVYSQPFSEGASGLPSLVWQQLRHDIQIFELAGLIAWGSIILMGLGLRLLDRYWKIEDWLEQPGPEVDTANLPWHQRPIPAPVLGFTVLVGLVAFSIVGCFAYYPEPEEVFEEMRIVRTEAMSAALSQEPDNALRWIEAWEDWTRRLEVGHFLRGGELSEYHRMKARVMRNHLELLEHEIEEGTPEEIKQQAWKADRAYRRLRIAFLEEGKKQSIPKGAVSTP